MFWTFMDLEKAFDRVDREALWRVLQMYGIGGRLMRAVKSFYEGSRTCDRAGRVRVIGWKRMLGYDRAVCCHHGCSTCTWMG